MPHERDLNDYILVFPADAGMEPIYVYLSEGNGYDPTKSREENARKPNIAEELTDEQKTKLGDSDPGTSSPSGNNHKDNNLSTSDQRSIRSLEEQIKEHETKLETYKKDPDSFDNKGYLKNAPSAEVRQRIIDGRTRHLENEIKVFKKNINEIKNGKG